MGSEIVTETGAYTHVVVDENESPLVWLARRRGRDGRVMIETHQLQAGERLRADFRRAHLMPRTSSNWSNPIPSRRRASGRQAAPLTETIIAARQRVHHALDAVGLEFSGLLLDVCCFLKGLEDVERERVWPARSAKIVIQLALDRLARHYGYAASTKGPTRANVRTWLANDAAFSVDELCYGRQRCIRLSANPLHHRTQAVGALRRKIFAKADMVEQRQGIDI